MLTDVLKKLASGAVSGSGAELLFGVVKTGSPLTVTVDSRFTLPEEALLLPEGLEELVLKITHDVNGSAVTDEIPLRSGLKAGDMVILLAAGGQYLILDRIGTPGRRQVAER